MINNVRPVQEPNDVQGVKYRVMQNPVYIGMFSALGGNAVPMAWSEVFPAVQPGALDGLEIPIMVINASRSEEHTSELQSLMRTSYSVFCLKKKNHQNTT